MYFGCTCLIKRGGNKGRGKGERTEWEDTGVHTSVHISCVTSHLSNVLHQAIIRQWSH